MINTNGILLHKYLEDITKLISSLPHINIIIHVSLDWIGAQGNIQRGLSEKNVY